MVWWLVVGLVVMVVCDVLEHTAARRLGLIGVSPLVRCALRIDRSHCMMFSMQGPCGLI